MYNQFYPYMNTNIIPNATRMATPALGAVAKTNPLSALFGARSAVPAASALGTATKSTFTFSGFLNGASKTLGVINQAIPVFYQVKPIINNAKTMYRVAKEINSSNKNQSTNNIKNNQEKTITNNKTNTTNDNKPNFFI